METVLYNGNIYTLEDEEPLVRALAYKEGVIKEIGSNEKVLKAASSGARSFDLDGLVVIPGLIDSHLHLMGLGLNLSRLDLTGTYSYQDILRMVEKSLDGFKKGGWILGWGWDQNKWPVKSYPSRDKLDEITGDIPVYLERVCGHAALVNGQAMEIAGITGKFSDPPGGSIVRDADGEPTGIVIDEAVDLVARAIPSIRWEDKCRLVEDAVQQCLRFGLVGVHDMGVSQESFSIYRRLKSEGRLPLRINAYWVSDQSVPDSIPALGEETFSANDLNVEGVKFFTDGSLGARSAAMLEDYSDDPGNRGIVVVDPEELKQQIRVCHSRGFQAAVHAIGDRANQIVLDIFREIFDSLPENDMRHRIEHAQVVSPSDMGRFARLGVIPSMQFQHLISDMPWAEERVGRERLKGAYAWRKLWELGCRVAGGSDAPVVSPNPFEGIYAGVKGFGSQKNYQKEEVPARSLPRREVLRSYTINAAYAVHQEEQRGTLSPGKLADFVILSKDIMNIPAEEILDIQVMATVVGGAFAYLSPDLSLFEHD